MKDLRLFFHQPTPLTPITQGLTNEQKAAQARDTLVSQLAQLPGEFSISDAKCLWGCSEALTYRRVKRLLGWGLIERKHHGVYTKNKAV